MKTFIIENEKLAVKIIDYGARIMSLYVKDADIDAVAGCDSPEDYLKDEGAYFGAAVGRYANRICDGRFTLNGTEYTLAKNNGKNSLHGGIGGFSMQYFDCEKVSDTSLICSYTEEDMAQGFPGRLTLKVTYTLLDNALSIGYEAVCDKDTVANFTNHAYFNLNGGGTVLDHLLCIHADKYLPIDESSIPLGKPEEVEGTPFDFRKATTIGKRINDDHPQLKAGAGYDHNFIPEGEGMREVAYLIGDKSGLRMDVYTDLPGIQAYSGNFMDADHPLMRGGVHQKKRTALCLETQLWPDSPNHPEYPSCVLKKGDIFKSETKYVFSVK